MTKRRVGLSSSEISGLWTTYIQESMSVCFLKYFVYHTKDEEIKTVLHRGLELSQSRLVQIEHIFLEEEFPVPIGFTDEDIDLTAPPLFHEIFGLSFIYAMSKMGTIGYSFVAASVAREDVRRFFSNCLQQYNGLYNDTVALMLSKGIYDRPPTINYPKEVSFIENESLFTGYVSKKRPLNVSELSEMFLNIERNFYGVSMCVGFLQVVKDEEIITYLQKGKDICVKQINLFNDLMQKEELFGTIPVTMEVTDSKISPFSDKLIMFHFHALNGIDIMLLGHALSMSMRTDLVAHISKIITEILNYSKMGFNLMVDRKWLEEPPHTTDRKKLIE